ncbi:PD-(D/E)XK nuclease family protein [Flavobacterium sp.]|uniref:PDDEXK-like family protein n=1 Tax=Flavobacterium sp. TaxID=239 RepID=UPI002CD4895E|nr:PD-(D/E)XK nuclease family protein [Flavobacterium sp.]HQA75262.1 PD-(D/E)XK nuclease family protein [Flavobacterium sp.]
MEDLNRMQHLLNNVSIISKKYEDIAKITGENFNIFSVIRMETDERYTHSAIIGELLNPKGSHGQGSVFLKLFFKEIAVLNEIEDFDYDSADLQLEQHIGTINKEYTKGGYIDLLIKDNKNCILIENKIYASDQKNQLVRYKNHYPNSVLLYLNLFGDEPSKNSSGKLAKDKDYFIISYKNEITKWLDNCYKEAVEQPILRETIKQYLNLVKGLTNQSINQKMSEEIIKMILNSEDYTKSALETKEAMDKIYNTLITKLVQVSKLSDDDKNYLNSKIKEVFLGGNLVVVEKFPDGGAVNIRFDVMFNNIRVLVLGVIAYQTNIKTVFWTNNEEFKELGNNVFVPATFDYYSTKEEIFDEVKKQILLLLEAVKNHQ